MSVIRFSEIPESGLFVSLSDKDLGVLLDGVSSPLLEAWVHPVKGGCTVVGNLKSSILLDCSFCTKKFQYQVSEKFSDLVLLNGNKSVQDDNSQMFVRFVLEPVLDFPLFAREIINLSIPIQVSCINDCKGLCSGCGMDLNYELCTCKGLEFENPFSVLKSIDI